MNMTAKTTGCCESCRFAEERPNGFNTFSCHRYPPETLTEWALVRGSDWCGEYAPVPKARKASGPPIRSSIDEITARWNSIKGVSAIQKWSEPRTKLLRLRMVDDEWFGRALLALDKLPHIPFALGQNARGWRANIDWFLRVATVDKILEQHYGDGEAGDGTTTELQTIEQFFSS